MAKNEINVYVHDETGASNENETGARANEKLSPSSQETVKANRKLKALAVDQMVGSSAFQYVASNVGRYTGDSSKQQAVNNIMQAIGIGAMALVSPALAATSVAVQGVAYALNENWRRREESVSLGQARARAGYGLNEPVANRRVK